MMISSDKTLTAATKTSQSAAPLTLWIRTAASPQIGFGHLKRSVVLARALRDCCKPMFLLDPEDCWSMEHLTNQNCDLFSGGLDHAWSVLPDPISILIDTRISRGLDSLIANANARGIPVISIHDLGLNPLPSTIVIDGSIAPTFLDIPHPDTAYFRGTDYMILDPSYRILHQQSKPIHKSIRSIFINLGGGNSGEYYSRVLEGLRLWGHEVNVIGVPGFASWGQEVLIQKDWHPLRFRWENQSIEQFLFQSDLAITAGGIAAYEALCAGTPLLALSYDHLQQTTLKMLGSSEACIDLGLGDELDPAELAGMLSLVEADIDKRKLLSSRGKHIVDGQGADRVAQIIRQSIHKSSTADR